MPHIPLNDMLPGIRGLMDYQPAIAVYLNALAEALLRTDEGLTMGERELIATHVSARNGCRFCQRIHGAVASYYLGEAMVENVRLHENLDPLSPKMRSLLHLADAVRLSGKSVTPELVRDALLAGASEKDVHDTVLIAAAFCMFNRYVDGHDTHAPEDPEMYRQRARNIAEQTGYAGSSPR